MKDYIQEFGEVNTFLDALSFFVFVTLGVLSKMLREGKKIGKKLTWKWFLSEVIMAVFVALIVWAIFDQFLEFNRFFTLAICSLAGSFSTTFNKNIEALIDSVFEAATNRITNLINKDQ